MIKFHMRGRWLPGQVLLRETPSSYRSTPEVDALIESAWRDSKARLGDKLFDGPMCRFERFECRTPNAQLQHPARSSLDIRHSTLILSVSRTSYRIFVGTNMKHPELCDTLGPHVMANTVGVSTTLITADNFLMLGRRSDNVAYYPRMLHPFAGSLEPGESNVESEAHVEGEAPAEPLVEPRHARDVSAGASPSTRRLDLFDEAMRELNEELGLTSADITEIACIGIVEDLRLRHPETILYARTTKTKSQIESNLLGHEHTAAWGCPLNALGDALRDRTQFTPVAQAAIELFIPFA